jgi:DNA-binding response OmpR family regulator
MKVLFFDDAEGSLAALAAQLDAGGGPTLCAATPSAALGAAGTGTYDALVLAPGLPPGDRRRVEGEARRRNPRIRIVLYYTGEPARDIFASAVLEFTGSVDALKAQLGEWSAD